MTATVFPVVMTPRSSEEAIRTNKALVWLHPDRYCVLVPYDVEFERDDLSKQIVVSGPVTGDRVVQQGVLVGHPFHDALDAWLEFWGE